MEKNKADFKPLYIASREDGTSYEVSKTEALSSCLTYRTVQPPLDAPKTPQTRFTDPKYKCDDEDLIGLDGTHKLTWVRLNEILPAKVKTLGFEVDIADTNLFSTLDAYPTFLAECFHLLPLHYKSLFLNSNLSNNGSYSVIVNVEGITRVQIVDDRVPVYQDTKQPIWGLRADIPWILIILKVWAKVIGGIQKCRSQKPFQFIKVFSFPNWKLKNLQKEPVVMDPKTNTCIMYDIFSKMLVPDNGAKYTVLVKTKDNQDIKKYGLVPNCGAYRVLGVVTLSNGKKAVKITSTVKSYWNGELSIIDPLSAKLFDPQKTGINLDKTFLLTWNDFIGLFNFMLVSRIDYKRPAGNKHTFVSISNPPKYRTSRHFSFDVRIPGKVDIVIMEGLGCQKQGNSYVRFKFVLSMASKNSVTKITSNSLKRAPRGSIIEKPPGKSSFIIPPSVNQNSYTFIDGGYFKGYTSSITYQNHLEPGRYIIHLKPETMPREITFGVHIVSESSVDLIPLQMTKPEKSQILRSSFLSHALQHGDIIQFDDGGTGEWICYGDTFDENGYGYIAYSTGSNSGYRLYCEINPMFLQKSGYSCKDIYKTKYESVGVYSPKGEPRCIILKKNKANSVWPPEGISLFRAL